MLRRCKHTTIHDSAKINVRNADKSTKQIFPFWKTRITQNDEEKTKTYKDAHLDRSCSKKMPYCEKSRSIDWVPTSIEYSSTSSNELSFDTDNKMATKQSRYDIPMEFSDKDTSPNNEASSDRLFEAEDGILDKYSMIVDEFKASYDIDNEELTFGSFGAESFVSDTALHDEIQKQREQIKNSLVVTINAKNEVGLVKRVLFDFTACFGHGSGSRNSLDSPEKYPMTKRFRLESDHILRLE